MHWWMKGCPRCRGDIFQEESWEEAGFKCLQCGHVLSAAEEARLVQWSRQTRAAPARASSLAHRKAA